jgi:hypothetical protein
MNEKELQNGREFDGEPDEIEEISYSTPPSSTTSHPFNGNNSSNGANNFSNSFTATTPLMEPITFPTVLMATTPLMEPITFPTVLTVFRQLTLLMALAAMAKS